MERSQWATVLEAQGPPRVRAPQDQLFLIPQRWGLRGQPGNATSGSLPWPGQPRTPATFIYLS